MANQPRPGMDHDLYRFQPIVDRPQPTWPGAAPVALWVVLYLEYWELDPPEDAYRDPTFRGEFGNYFPDYRTYTTREYGNRVGIFRLFEVLDRHRIPVTVAANGAACERYPYLIEQCLDRGWEIAAHGTHATRMITSRMTAEQERAYISESIAAVERATGRRPLGWISQDFGESPRTPGLLAEAGLAYCADWPNDDQPYEMLVGAPPLISLPYHVDLDDVRLLWLRQVLTPRYPELVRDAFDTLYVEGRKGGRMLGLGVHPWVFGQAHRIRYLDQALAYISGHDEVWKATGSEICRAFVAGRTGP